MAEEKRRERSRDATNVWLECDLHRWTQKLSDVTGINISCLWVGKLSDGTGKSVPGEAFGWEWSCMGRATWAATKRAD